MFERYTEKARRVIFFARYEASQLGSPEIASQHLLLGLLREDKNLTNRFLRSHATVESIRRQIEEHVPVREKVSPSVDLPLSNDGTRILGYATEEAERLAHQHIGTEHLLLGMLREERCFAAKILTERGLRLNAVRLELHTHPVEPRQSVPGGGISGEAAKIRQDLASAIGPLGIFQVALRVRDQEASRSFYMRLGFHVLGMGEGVAVLANGNCRLALCEGEKAEMLMSFTGGDLAGLEKQLGATGLRFETTATQADGTAVATLRDPDGHALSFTFHTQGAGVVWPEKSEGER